MSWKASFTNRKTTLVLLPFKIVKTLNDPQSTLLAESLRSFLDKSGKTKEESGKRKEERGKRKEVLSVTKHGFLS